MASDPTRDEVMEKFSKNLKKLLDKREPSGTPKRKHHHSSRGVRFNPETVDVSFGGTESSGKIKDLTLDSTKIDIQIDVDGDKRERSRGNSRNPPKSSMDNGTNNEFKVPSSKPSKPNHSTDASRPKSPRRNSASETKQNNNKHANGHSIGSNGSSFVNGQPCTPVRRHTMDQLKKAEGGMSTPDCFNPVSLAETPGSSLSLKNRKPSDDGHITEDSSVTVAVRVRPFSARQVNLRYSGFSLLCSEHLVLRRYTNLKIGNNGFQQ